LKGKTNIFIVLKEQINFEKLLSKSGVSVYEIKNHDERGYLVMNTLIKQQEESQKSIIEFLKRRGLSYRSYWISNSIFVDNVNEHQVKELAERSDIRLINSNEEFKVDLEDPLKEVVNPLNGTEWNVKWVNGDKVWELGFEGKDIITGVSDTGVIHNHPALINSYRGKKDDGSFDHNYSWLEPYQPDARIPVDTNGHGTHCAGTVCGGVDRKIGVAPKAKFIACRGISQSGSGTVEGYTKCFQFFAAPTDLDFKNPKPELRPHVTSHSYQCGRCQFDDLKKAAEALTASGVLLVVAAQNAGPACSSVRMAPGIYQTVLSVGALNKEANTLASFSSKGPVRVDNSNRLKPEISAPGVNVVSAAARGGYTALSGTSMATPCVAGCVALLWNAVPSLSRNINKTLEILYKTALGQRSNDCTSSGSPNNLFGYGTIDIMKAVQTARKLTK